MRRPRRPRRLMAWPVMAGRAPSARPRNQDFTGAKRTHGRIQQRGSQRRLREGSEGATAWRPGGLEKEGGSEV